MNPIHVLADTMTSADTAVPWGLWLMVIQAGVVGVALVVGLSRTHWRMGGALARGARLLTAGMILFAAGHITAFLLSLFAPSLSSGVIFIVHHGAALSALVCIAVGFGQARDQLAPNARGGLIAYATWTLPVIALVFVLMAVLGLGLPVPGAPQEGMLGGPTDMGSMGMGNLDAMRELSNGVSLAHVALDAAVACMGLLALALGSSLHVGGMIGRALRRSLVSITALVVVYPITTLLAAFQPGSAAWLEMGLCFTVTSAFAVFVGSISAIKATGPALDGAARIPSAVGMRGHPRW
jgi:hypothetical protein